MPFIQNVSLRAILIGAHLQNPGSVLIQIADIGANFPVPVFDTGGEKCINSGLWIMIMNVADSL